MKGILVLMALVISFLVYLGVPYEIWHWLTPVSFWEKTALVIGTCMYEWFMFWIGFISWAWLFAVLFD